MRRKDAPPELADQRMALTCKIAELRKEDKIAEGALHGGLPVPVEHPFGASA